MRLSTKSRFAVTAMIDIGLREHRGPVSLAAISQRHNISISYLEQIFKNMREQGLVDSTRGPGGGYTLNRHAHQITVADIIRAVHIDEDDHTHDAQVKQQGFVSTEDLWNNLNQKLEDHMRAISLQSLIAAQQSKGETVQELSSPKRGVFAQKQKPVVPSKVPNSVFALGGV
jgi:Rrf2 family transcriptional regulator, iron-sulfur cluster assembly transcription factor